MRAYAEAIHEKGAPIANCWKFIDGTARGICRPTINQQAYYSGHKRFHRLEYQSVVCPDGMIVSLLGPFEGRRHDTGILRESMLYEQLQAKVRFTNENKFVLYGDPAYPIRELLLRPYSRTHVTPLQAHFNKSMSAVRQSVEWAFGKVSTKFAFVDFKKNQKMLLQEVPSMYKVAVLLTNCHTCLNSSQTSLYFEPLSLEEYLGI